MEFNTAKEVAEYLQSQKWRGKGRKEPLTTRSVQMHVKAGLLKRGDNGKFSLDAVKAYANRQLEDDASLVEKNSLDEAIKKEQLRKLKIENDKKAGELVSLSEEIKRRVAVLQDIKAGMINHRATFTRRLSEQLKKRGHDGDMLSDMMIDAAELYEDGVVEVFDRMGKERGA